jgi:ubiquinone biosynthesis protein
VTTTFARMAIAVRDVARTRQILAILLRYGFGDLLARLPLEGPLQLGVRALRRSPLRAISRLSTAERIRRALEELGPAFVKLGQLLAGRPDLVPHDVVVELEKLRDDVEPMPGAAARMILETELGKSPDEIFSRFDETPLAAGSIAQVHVASLAEGGREVVIKIQRTDVQPILEGDLRILRFLAELARGRLLSEEVVDPVGIVDELARMLERECDFRLERRTMDRFRRNFAEDPTVRIPGSFPELSTGRVLVMERIVGERPGDPAKLRAVGLDPAKLATRGATAFARMVLEHGLFHADPHGGNLLFCPGDVVAFLDFGAAGRLSPMQRDRLLDLVVAMGGREVTKAAALFLEIGQPAGPVDREKLEEEIEELLDNYHGLPIGEIPIGPLLGDFFGLLRRHRIRFPSDLVVLARALFAFEGEGKRLDPGFDLVSELKGPILGLLAERMSPLSRFRRFAASAEQMAGFLTDLPAELRRVLGMIEARDFEVRLSHVGLEGLVREIDRASNRIAFALVIAALIVGSAIVSNLGRGPSIAGYPAVGVFGFLLAGFLGLWLAVAILRSGKL